MANIKTTIEITTTDPNEYTRIKQWLTDVNDTIRDDWNPVKTLDDVNYKVTLVDNNTRTW